MLQRENTATGIYDVPRGEGGPQRGAQHNAPSWRTRPRGPRTETVSLRDLRNLCIYSLVWAGYLWVHVAGAISLFGRP
jgi:hypothetical protein